MKSSERALTAAETHACPSPLNLTLVLSAAGFLPGPKLSDRVLPEAAAERELPFPGRGTFPCIIQLNINTDMLLLKVPHCVDHIKA